MRDNPDGSPLDETLATSSMRRKAGRPLIVALQIFTFVALMGIWQILSATKILDPFFFSRPSDIALRLWDWLSTGFIWPHLLTTLTEALLAFVIGTMAGVGLGLAFARVDLLPAVFDPYIRILNALPRVILSPIFLLWFALAIASTVPPRLPLLFFFVFFNTHHHLPEP